jgi:hypothetical protein
MKTYLAIFLGGIAGTAVLTLFLLLPSYLGWGRVEVFRAVGSLMTGKSEKAFSTGVFLHIALGILFAYVYAGFLSLSHLPFNALSGLFLGTLHGSVVMLLVGIVILEHHPVAAYHERGPAMGLAQLVAHMLYGVTVGAVVSLLSAG